MKRNLSVLVCWMFALQSWGQIDIAYDLDSYRRVDGFFRTTLIRPQVTTSYRDEVNVVGMEKDYSLGVRGSYADYQLTNSLPHQKEREVFGEFDLSAGSLKQGELTYRYSGIDRNYNEQDYFKIGGSIEFETKHREVSRFVGSSYTSESTLDLSSDLGFGFGRLEVVNDAWLAASILEELAAKNLLREIPDSLALRTYFDYLGQLEFERVLDFRMREIYVIEKLIAYLEEQNWIEKGSIPAFATIYDAYRYEQFFFRQTGRRLEFTLTPQIEVEINKSTGQESALRNIRPGFIGTIQYDMHRNGDIKYYVQKGLGASLRYIERFTNVNDFRLTYIDARIDYTYVYRYLPSLRTNFLISFKTEGGFTNANSFQSFLLAECGLKYNYFFTPTTRLEVSGNFGYTDPEFQVGDFQPRLNGFASCKVVHAIR